MKKYAILGFFFLCCAAGSLFAQATLSVQGTVKNSDGSAVSNGKYSFKFSLYTTESGGTPVWTETQDNVQVTGGVYSALLGAANPLNAAFDRVYYMGVGIDGGAEWIPRAKLSSSPYALSLVGTSNVFPSSGAIGAGTTSPDPNTQLTVSGGSGDGKVLITAPGDKQSILWIRSGDKLGGMYVAPSGAMALNAPGNFDLSAVGRINIGSNNNENVHFYQNGVLRAYAHGGGFTVNGTCVVGGDLSTNQHITAGGSLVTGSGDINTSGADLRLYRNGDRHILLRGDGWTQFDKGIYVPNGNDTYFPSDMFILNPVGYAHWAFIGTKPVSIHAEKAVRGTFFITQSDARIKKDIRVSTGKADLATLMQLEVTDYRYIDTFSQGSAMVKGFIAQQVAKVFPAAVSISQSTIPDIFAQPVAVQVNGNEATFQLSADCNYIKGDRVRIIQNQGEEKNYEVIHSEGTKFTVTDWNPSFNEAKKIFIFGKEVKDFHLVDYDKIHNLNVSATQELARQVEALRKENAALKSDIDVLRAENTELKTADARLEARLRVIEANLPNH